MGPWSNAWWWKFSVKQKLRSQWFTLTQKFVAAFVSTLNSVWDQRGEISLIWSCEAQEVPPTFCLFGALKRAKTACFMLQVKQNRPSVPHWELVNQTLTCLLFRHMNLWLFKHSYNVWINSASLKSKVRMWRRNHGVAVVDCYWGAEMRACTVKCAIIHLWHSACCFSKKLVLISARRLFCSAGCETLYSSLSPHT